MFGKFPEELKLELARTLRATLSAAADLLSLDSYSFHDSHLHTFHTSPQQQPSAEVAHTGAIVIKQAASEQEASIVTKKSLSELCTAASLGWWTTVLLDQASKEKNRDLK